MKSLYQHLDRSQLVTILEIICGETGLLIDTDRDPDSNQHRVYAAHPTGGTFTVLSLPKPITRRCAAQRPNFPLRCRNLHCIPITRSQR